MGIGVMALRLLLTGTAFEPAVTGLYRKGEPTYAGIDRRFYELCALTRGPPKAVAGAT